MFKLAALDGWIIVLNGRALSEELRKLPDSVRSFYEATNQVRPFRCPRRTMAHTLRCAQLLQTEFIMSHEFVNDMFHVEILRTVLPKKLDNLSLGYTTRSLPRLRISSRRRVTVGFIFPKTCHLIETSFFRNGLQYLLSPPHRRLYVERATA